MNLTKFKLEYEYLCDLFQDRKHEFTQRFPDKNYEKEIFYIIDRFCRRGRLNYLRFGPYWWAVKSVMNAQGFHYYEIDDAPVSVLISYSMPNAKEIDPFATLMAAWEFKGYYDSHYFQGNRQFQLGDDGEDWALHDPKWEYLFDTGALV